jgi:hypothetical protein
MKGWSSQIPKVLDIFKIGEAGSLAPVRNCPIAWQYAIRVFSLRRSAADRPGNLLPCDKAVRVAAIRILDEVARLEVPKRGAAFHDLRMPIRMLGS